MCENYLEHPKVLRHEGILYMAEFVNKTEGSNGEIFLPEVEKPRTEGVVCGKCGAYFSIEEFRRMTAVKGMGMTKCPKCPADDNADKRRDDNLTNVFT